MRIDRPAARTNQGDGARSGHRMDERDAMGERTPVILGVGQVNDRPQRPEDGLDPVGLMAEALRRADRDAGGGMLAECGSLAVVSQLAWPQLNPVDGKLAEALALRPRTVSRPPRPMATARSGCCTRPGATWGRRGTTASRLLTLLQATATKGACGCCTRRGATWGRRPTAVQRLLSLLHKRATKGASG